MSNLPEHPEEIPKYIREGLEKQDVGTLEEVIQYSRELVEYLTEPPEVEPDEDEELLEKEERSGYTKVVKKVPCGKDCSGCPHGPYVYHVSRSGGGTVDWEYIGPLEE
jgi:hypothetical protein